MRVERGSWAWKAQQVIDPLFTQAKREGWTRGQLEKAISIAYPFHERAMFPYKMWLKVRKMYLTRWDADERLKASLEKPEDLELA